MTRTRPIVSPASSVVGASEIEMRRLTPFSATKRLTASSSASNSRMVLRGRSSIPNDLTLSAMVWPPFGLGRDDFLDSGNLFLQGPLDSHLQGHGGHGAMAAGPNQLHLDDAIIGHFDQFHITAVGLKGRANQFQDFFYLFK